MTTPMTGTLSSVGFDLLRSNHIQNFSTIACYEDMKGNTKCRNCGGLELGLGHRQCRLLIEHIRLSNRF